MRSGNRQAWQAAGDSSDAGFAHTEAPAGTSWVPLEEMPLGFEDVENFQIVRSRGVDNEASDPGHSRKNA